MIKFVRFVSPLIEYVREPSEGIRNVRSLSRSLTTDVPPAAIRNS